MTVLVRTVSSRSSPVSRASKSPPDAQKTNTGVPTWLAI
jgi:hypothetical protein